MAGKDVKEITAHLFSGIRRDSVVLWGKEGGTVSPKWERKRKEEAEFSIFTIFSPSRSARLQGQGLHPDRSHPCTGSEVLPLKFTFDLVRADFVGSLQDNTSGKQQK